jgi:putative MATE family efflux protein
MGAGVVQYSGKIKKTEARMSFIRKFIGDRKFYRTVLGVAVPMMIQNGITNLVNLLDNVMVGTLSTEAMSGVSIVNQFIFIFNLMVFGAVSAAGIFTAQYHGLGDNEGVRYTFRFKFIVTAASGFLSVLIFGLFDEQLVGTFLHAGSVEGDLALTLMHGQEYLLIMLAGLIPYAIAQAYASTMRETGETVVPMVASTAAVFTNFVLNCLLIFGLFGLPALGVRGAAIATVTSRGVELGILLLWGYRHPDRCPYLAGALHSLYLPRRLFSRITVKGLPLMLNEVFWAMAITFRNQCYSTRGLDVVAAQNISSTIVNLFSVVYMALGGAIAIVVGNELGAGKLEKARDTARKMMAFSIFCASAMAGLLVVTSTLFPRLYDTSDGVRSLAAYMIVVSAALLPFCAYAHAAYFTLRSGGKVAITMLMDSGFMWACVVPISTALAYATGMSIYWLYPLCQATEILKVALGAILLKKYNWARKMV